MFAKQSQNSMSRPSSFSGASKQTWSLITTCRSFILCRQGSSILWTPALRPFEAVQCASPKREGERERTLFATQIGTKESYNRIVQMRGRLHRAGHLKKTKKKNYTKLHLNRTVQTDKERRGVESSVWCARYVK